MSDIDRESMVDDERLLADLQRVLAIADPMPGYVTAAARAALGMRALDAELAELLSDSDAESALALSRSTRAVRLLSFATSGGEVEVEMQVESDGPGRNIVGQLLGAAAGSLSFDTDGGSVEVPLDAAGLFTVRGLPGGLVRMRCTSAAGQPVATSWVLL